MATILVATIPVIGHVSPMLPIAEMLVRRGHDVHWYTGAKFEDRIEEIGVSWVPMQQGLDYSIETNVPQEIVEQRAALSGIAQLKFDLEYFFIKAAVTYTNDLLAFLETVAVDAVVADSFFIAASWVHELGGPPWAQLGISVLTLPSRDTAPFGLGLRPTSTWLGAMRNLVLYWLLKHRVFKSTYEAVNEARLQLSLPPTDTLLFDVISPYLYLAGTVPSFEYPRRDLPPQVHFIGSSIPTSQTDFSPPEWWDDLNRDQPVILVTQGTVATDPVDLIIPTLQALETEDVLVVATTGSKPERLLESCTIPANARVERFIDFRHLLPRVDVMVTNGGYNGVQLALANGVPLVVSGKSEDKPEVCARVGWSGAGINLNAKRPKPSQIVRALQRVLTEDRYRSSARRIQAEIARYHPAGLAADLVEQLAAGHKPVLKQ